MPSFWMEIEKAGLFRKEIDAMIKRDPLKYLKECGEKIALANIQARNWLSRGTTSFIPFPAVRVKFPKVYYNPETDYFTPKKRLKPFHERKRISKYHGGVLSHNSAIN